MEERTHERQVLKPSGHKKAEDGTGFDAPLAGKGGPYQMALSASGVCTPNTLCPGTRQDQQNLLLDSKSLPPVQFLMSLVNDIALCQLLKWMALGCIA